MRKRPFLALLAVAAMLAPAAGCRCSGEQDGTTSPPATTTKTAEPTLAEQAFQLQNGLRADLVTGPCGDSVALVVLVNVGLDHDPPGRSGMARLAGRVLSASAPPGRAARTVETGTDYTLYSVVVPSDRLLYELDDVAAWMSKAAPTEADRGRELAKMVEEIVKLSGADAAATAMKFAEESVQPTRGNGKRAGVAAELEAITLAELQAFWDAHFKPGNARISIAGRFDAEKARARIEAAFAPLPAGTPPVLRDAAQATVRGTLVMGSAPTAVAVAVPVPATSDPLFTPFLVLAARLMDKGSQPRTWDASYDPLRRRELLFITGPVGPTEQAEPAAGRIRAEAAAILARPLEPEDIAKARETFRLFLEPKLVGPALCEKDARAFAAARARRAQLGLDIAAIAQALDATTKELLDEAAKLFDPKQTAAVIAGGAMR